MKLNIGCGYKKLQGYINIDINPYVKPDFVMDAYNLDFNDKHFNEVLASQVIEHLGFFKTKYFLSEANRILNKEKFLIIETPYIEKSFELFLNSKNIEERERILGWIYGSESRGMNHIYCFPTELIEDLLDEFGFEIYKKEFFDYEHLRPAVRYVSFKKRDYEKSHLRKKIIDYGIFKIEDEIYYSEIEKMIKEIDLKISIDKIIEYAFISPKISLILLELNNEKGYLDIMKKLIDNNFTGWIYEVTMKYYRDFNNIEIAYSKVKEIFDKNNIEFIENFLNNNRKGKRDFFILNRSVVVYEFNKLNMI